MIPEGKLIRKELAFRALELNDDVKLTKKSLVRWLALSLGIVSARESRRTAIDLLECLLNFHLNEQRAPTASEIINELSKLGHKEKAIRYHLLQLQKRGLVRREKRCYELGLAQNFDEFKSDCEKELEDILEKIREALSALRAKY